MPPQALTLYETDTPGDIKWDDVESLTSILLGVNVEKDVANCLTVPWESILGRIIRKNLMNFRIWEMPESGAITTDISSVKTLLCGIIENNLNPKLTSEGLLLQILAF